MKDIYDADNIKCHFDRSEGLRELYCAVVNYHSHYGDLFSLTAEKLNKLKKLERTIDAVLIAYYARNHFLVNSFPNLEGDIKEGLARKLYMEAEDLCEGKKN